MRRSFVAALIVAGSIALASSTVGAQTPEEDGGTSTPSTSLSPTPSLPTPSPTLPTMEPTAAPAVGATLTGRIVEDLDSDRLPDDADGIPSQSVMYLTPWSRTDAAVGLLTENGRFTFSNIPEGDYTLRIYWPAGFASPEAASDLPHILRAVFHVNTDGTISAPPVLPKTWPGRTDEPFDPAQDRTIIGAIPDPILVNRKDPNVLATVPDAGADTIALGSGSIDVSVALGGTTLALPSTGEGQTAGSRGWMAFLGIGGVGLLVVLWFVRRRIQPRT